MTAELWGGEDFPKHLEPEVELGITPPKECSKVE